MNFQRYLLGVCIVVLSLVVMIAENKCLGTLGCYGYNRYGTHYPMLLPKLSPYLRSKLYRKYWALKKPLLYKPMLLPPPCLCSSCSACPLSMVHKCLKHKANLALCT
uniref:Uncharacterized protein n=1 Tax=Rhodnius prolixus TaxID=13249 RepID=G1K0E3_RHOPR